MVLLGVVLIIVVASVEIGNICGQAEGGVWKLYGNVEYMASPWNLLPPWPYPGYIHNFTSARQQCRIRGGDLASIPDSSTMTWLTGNILPASTDICIRPQQYDFWIGLTNLYSSACSRCTTNWYWPNGSISSTWVQNRWYWSEPGTGDRHAYIGGCSSYKLWGGPEDNPIRYLCQREYSILTPTQVNAVIPTTVEQNRPFNVTCTIPRLYPSGLSSTSFVLLLDDGSRLTTTTNVARETPNLDNTNALNLVYTATLALDKSYSGSTLKCQAAVLGGYTLTSSRSNPVAVLYEPTVVESDFTYFTTTKEGEMVTRSCQASDSNPRVSTFVWRMNGKLLAESGMFMADVDITRSELNYTGKVEDDGGNLTCTPVWNDKLLTKLTKSTIMDITATFAGKKDETSSAASSTSASSNTVSQTTFLAVSLVFGIILVGIIVFVAVYFKYLLRNKHGKYGVAGPITSGNDNVQYDNFPQNTYQGLRASSMTKGKGECGDEMYQDINLQTYSNQAAFNN